MRNDESTTLLEIKGEVKEIYENLQEKSSFSLQSLSMNLGVCTGKVMQVTREFPELQEDRKFGNKEGPGREEISAALLEVFVSAINLANHLDLDISAGIRETLNQMHKDKA